MPKLNIDKVPKQCKGSRNPSLLTSMVRIASPAKAPIFRLPPCGRKLIVGMSEDLISLATNRWKR